MTVEDDIREAQLIQRDNKPGAPCYRAYWNGDDFYLYRLVRAGDEHYRGTVYEEDVLVLEHASIRGCSKAPAIVTIRGGESE